MPVDHDSCELLRAIVRAPHDLDAHRIRVLADKVGDWDALLTLAQEHCVLPILFMRLAQMDINVPAAAQQRLRAEYDRNVLHNLTNAAELIEVLNVFEREMIPAMPFKGAVLGASVYHDLTTRTAGDLDLLIYPGDIARSTDILLKRGYELITDTSSDPDCYEYHFERQTDGMVLEIRWMLELTQPRFRRDLGMDWIWPHRRTIMLAGAEVPDMNPEMTLLVLCMHGSKHLWSRLLWIHDVAQLVASSPGLDWSAVIRQAKASGLRRALALGVLLAHRVVGISIPPAILRSFESDATACRLAHYVDENLLDAPGSFPIGRVPYNVQILDFQDRVKLLFSFDFLRPNERDMTALALPKSLHALYYLIRPFRILWDRSAR
ncbi:MAG TPA: nucleotidyltransferase family protein [Pseudacidobacterium sp.]|jgi:hypothetical protein|nr:nucleotidyltransferase family protein [Pseudacidobacterium sp.]